MHLILSTKESSVSANAPSRMSSPTSHTVHGIKKHKPWNKMRRDCGIRRDKFRRIRRPPVAICLLTTCENQ